MVRVLTRTCEPQESARPLRRGATGILLCGLAAALGLLAQAAVAQELFGIALDQPLQIDECAQRLKQYLSDASAICFKADALPVDGSVTVNLPRSDRPAFMTGSDAVVGLHAGRVASISVKTAGALRDNDDLADLERRFGKTDAQFIANSPPGGSSYESIRADWKTEDGTRVYFNSSEFGTYDGLVRIQSRAAMAHRTGTWD